MSSILFVADTQHDCSSAAPTPGSPPLPRVGDSAGVWSWHTESHARVVVMRWWWSVQQSVGQCAVQSCARSLLQLSRHSCTAAPTPDHSHQWDQPRLCEIFCKPGWVNCKINCKAAPHPCLIIGECQVALIIKTCSEIAFLRQVVDSDTFWSNFSVVKNVLTTTAAQLIRMLKFISTTLVNYLLWYSTVVCREGIFSTNFSCSYKEPINYWVDVASLAWLKNIFSKIFSSVHHACEYFPAEMKDQNRYDNQHQL